MSAQLIISRTASDDIGFRGLDILLDGKFLVNLSFGDKVTLDIEIGEHTLLATNSLYKEKIDFKVQQDESIRFAAANILTRMGRVFVALGGALYRVRLEQLPENL